MASSAGSGAAMAAATSGATRASTAASESAATAVAEPADEPDETTRRCWQATVTAINARKRMLGAFLEESRLVGSAEGAILLAMDDLHRAVVEEKANRSLVAEELLRAFGQPLELRCLPADSTQAPPKPAAGEVNEMIARTLAWFGGESIAPNDARRKGEHEELR
jgi:hypothetical protein